MLIQISLLKEAVAPQTNTTPPSREEKVIQLLISGPGALGGLGGPALGHQDAPGPAPPGLFQGPQGLCHAVT